MTGDGHSFCVAKGQEGRADRFVQMQYPDASRSSLARLFAEKAVYVGGKAVKKGHLVRTGDLVRLLRAPGTAESLRVVPCKAPLEVLYQDATIVVVAKPAGIPTHPLREGEVGTLANALVHRFPECALVGEDPREAGFAHRLDTGTSGVLLAARVPSAWKELRRGFANKEIVKIYLAAVQGVPNAAGCDLPLLQRGSRVVVDDEGLWAQTSWEIVSKTGDYSLVRCTTSTGRMHQVRAHLAACGSPIVGDVLYGGDPVSSLQHHFLHALTVRFPHPDSRNLVEFTAPLSLERQRWLELAHLALDRPALS